MSFAKKYCDIEIGDYLQILANKLKKSAHKACWESWI